MERKIIQSNSKRDIIKVSDFKNNKCKYIYYDNATGAEHDIRAPYPASKENYIWHDLKD